MLNEDAILKRTINNIMSNMMAHSVFDNMLLPLHVIVNVSMIRIINTPLKKK